MARRAAHYKKRATTGRKCPYSDDCFNCPLPDCRAGSCFAWSYNILPGDVERGNKGRGRGGPGMRGDCNG